MVKTYAGNEGVARLHHIGCIQPPPHSGFNHRHINRLIGKPGKSNGRRHLKKSGATLQNSLLQHGSIERNPLLGNRPAVNAHPLSKINKMR